jgi:acetate kinase
LAAAIGGVDAFVFTARIGENSPVIREKIVDKLSWLGAAIDPDANVAGREVIHDRTVELAFTSCRRTKN